MDGDRQFEEARKRVAEIPPKIEKAQRQIAKSDFKAKDARKSEELAFELARVRRSARDAHVHVRIDVLQNELL